MRRTAAGVFAGALAACAPQGAKLDDAIKLAQAAEERAKSLDDEIGHLKARLAELERGVASATVRTDVSSFDIAKNKYGSFTVAARGVQPYLDGYKVVLNVGNLTAAAFDGVKLKVEWGKPWDPKDAKAYFESRREKEFTFTQQFKGGAFTEVEVVLSPAQPSEVKELEVSLSANSVSLIRARPQ